MRLVAFLKNGESRWAPGPYGLPRVGACITWFDDHGGATEPWPFLESFVEKLLPRLPGVSPPAALFLRRRRRVLFGRYKETLLRSEPLETSLGRSKSDPECEFPDRIEFRSNEQPQCVIETEFWNQGGGPAPYHDSVTLSVYSSVISGELVLEVTRDAAEACAARFDELD